MNSIEILGWTLVVVGAIAGGIMIGLGIAEIRESNQIGKVSEIVETPNLTIEAMSESEFSAANSLASNPTKYKPNFKYSDGNESCRLLHFVEAVPETKHYRWIAEINSESIKVIAWTDDYWIDKVMNNNEE